MLEPALEKLKQAIAEVQKAMATPTDKERHYESYGQRCNIEGAPDEPKAQKKRRRKKQ